MLAELDRALHGHPQALGDRTGRAVDDDDELVATEPSEHRAAPCELGAQVARHGVAGGRDR